MIHEIQALVKAGIVRVGSVHNFCPIPGGDNSDQSPWREQHLSSPEPEDRVQAVALTRETIDWAVRLGARAVVVHLGTIPLDARHREALRLIGAGMKEDAKMVVMEDLYERASLRGPYLESTLAITIGWGG